MVSYWRFEDTSGTTAADSFGSNTGNHINVITRVVPYCKQLGMSLYCNGNYVRVPNDASLAFTNFSIEAWIKTTSSGFQVVCGKYASGSPYSGYAMGIDTGKAQIWVGDVPGGWFKGTTTINDNIWHHVVVTLNGTTVNIYVDGALDSTATRNPSLSSTSQLTIGTDPGSNGANNYIGFVNEVAVYNTDISLSTIQDHYVAANTSYAKAITNTSGLLSYWQLDESGSSTSPEGINSNTGTYVGSATQNQTSNGTQLGTSVLFSGNGYISVPHHASLNVTNFTIEAWVRTTSNASMMVLTKFGVFPSAGYGMSVDNGKVNIWCGDGTNSWYAGNASVNDGAWHYIAVTLSGTTVKTYIDGALDSTGTRTPTTLNSSTLLIASNAGYPNNTNFDGYLDDIALYNTALDATTINNHYVASLGNSRIRATQEAMIEIYEAERSVRITQEVMLLIIQTNYKVTSLASSAANDAEAPRNFGSCH